MTAEKDRQEQSGDCSEVLDLDAIRARCEAAAPGPWHDATDDWEGVHYSDYGWTISGPDGQSPDWDVDSDQCRADVLFIGHARSDIPALLDALDALTELARAFSPKVVPLDVTPEGTYEESTTRWGMNPVYEAVPSEIRAAVEADLPADTQRYFAHLREG